MLGTRLNVHHVSGLPPCTGRILTEIQPSCLLGWAGMGRAPRAQSPAPGTEVVPGAALVSQGSCVRHQPQPSPPTPCVCPWRPCTNTPCPQAVALPPSTPPAGHCCLPCSCPGCLQRNPEGTNVLCVTYSLNISLL